MAGYVMAGDFRKGVTFKYESKVVTVVEFLHVKPGKGAAFVTAKLKNLRTGAIIEERFNAGTKVGQARIEKKPMQFLYSMNDNYTFMEMNTYEQIELSKSVIGDDAKLLKENLEVDIMFYEGEMLGMNLPDKIAMKVVHTEPGVKGNTTSTAMKDAELETGLVIKVPMFIDQDEIVLISSKDGKYVSRA